MTTPEHLLNEFHHPSTTNNKKHEIEVQLLKYQTEVDAWKLSLPGVADFSKQLLWFFNVSTIEVTITRKWHSLCPNERDEIRSTLWNVYINLSPDVATMQRDKIAQLIAQMGKREFPNDHSTYVSHVLELMRTKLRLGVALLRATSEELTSTREDISSERKKYFHTCLSMCMNDVFDLVAHVLAVCVCKRDNGKGEFTLPSGVDPALSSALPADSQVSVAITELLLCVQHLFSWVNLEEIVNDLLLSGIFEFARWIESCSAISVAALQAITELFYRQRALPLPFTIANCIRKLLHEPNLVQSNEMYQDKFTELLRLFTTQHWSKWVIAEGVMDTVNALYNYTFTGYGALSFTEKLSIWSPIINSLSPNGRFTDVVHLLVSGILRKMQFRFDQDSELEMLDNSVLDDDMETEWQHYLTQCIETIASVAEKRPNPVFEQVFLDWQVPFEIFMSLEQAINENTLVITDQSKCHLIHCALRDLSSLCQTLTRLAPILQVNNNQHSENLNRMTYCILYAIKFSTSKKLHTMAATSALFPNDFADTFAQMLAAVRSLLTWVPALTDDTELRTLIENIVTILLPSSNVPEPKIITLATAQLLLSISSIVRPKYMLEIAPMAQLVDIGHNLTHLDKHVVVIVQQIIVNCFVLPWTNVANNDQNFQERGRLLHDYTSRLATDLLSLDMSYGQLQQEKMVTVTTALLPVLKENIDYFRESTSMAKTMILSAYKPIIEKSLHIFNTFGTSIRDIADCVLNFSLAVVRTLQIQLGSVYIRDMLSVFLDASTREQLTIQRLKATDKLLQMLTLVVEQPGCSSLSLLPPTLNFALDHVAPLLLHEKNAVDHSDVAFSLYTLFDSILHYRWQYFYKSHVLRGFSPGASDTGPAADDSPLHSEQFLAILTTYGRALVNGNDPHLTRTVLMSLQSLNEKWKLYNREFFKMHLLSSFHCALINALMSPEGALHYDFLMAVLFSMGRVDIAILHKSFVDIGYSADSTAIEDVCLAVDLPTFSNKMSQLIQDTRCSQMSK